MQLHKTEIQSGALATAQVLILVISVILYQLQLLCVGEVPAQALLMVQVTYCFIVIHTRI